MTLQRMTGIVAAAVLLAACADALTVVTAGHNATSKQPMTLTSYYNAKTTGRGVWKWNDAVIAYQRHFGGLVGKPVSIAEVGVQSGGSLLMWRDVFGKATTKLYGFDIQPACEKFEEPNVMITIGDQGDVNMWNSFYTKTKVVLDILIDDGGHQPPLMLTTLTTAFPHIKPGGYIAIEDIMVCPSCPDHLTGFFHPTAKFLAPVAAQGQVDSVHLYPLLLVVRKGGFPAGSPQAAEGVLQFAGEKTAVTEWDAMLAAINTVPPGSHIEIRNAAWGSLFSDVSLTNFFNSFYGLHDTTAVDTPPGCSVTADAVCTNAVNPLKYPQTKVTGVHIYKDYAVIEIAAQTPVIEAVRKGTEWSTTCR